jgi:hypothetical protein
MTTPDFPDAMARLLATAAEDGFDVRLDGTLWLAVMEER